jgi:hypothetical protein
MFESDVAVIRAPAPDGECATSAEMGAAAGQAAYTWNLVTDEIQWDRDAGRALKIADLSRIATGRAYDRLHDAVAVENEPASASLPDADRGVPYHTRYWLYPRASAAARLWVEDIGRWHRDSSGAPRVAVGVVRVLAEEPPPDAVPSP